MLHQLISVYDWRRCDAIRNEKRTTKDVDLILPSQSQAAEITLTFSSLGMNVNLRPVPEVKITQKETVVSNADIFVGKICNGLRFSDGMRDRAELFEKMGNIDLYLLSREDIFLLKSVTDRSRDIDEMAVLYRKGLKKTILFEECANQDLLDDPPYARIWEGFLLERMKELTERYGFRVPWIQELEDIAEMKVGAAIVLNKVRDSTAYMGTIEQGTGISEDELERYIAHLEGEGLISVDRGRHPHVLSLMPSKRKNLTPCGK